MYVCVSGECSSSCCGNEMSHLSCWEFLTAAPAGRLVRIRKVQSLLKAATALSRRKSWMNWMPLSPAVTTKTFTLVTQKQYQRLKIKVLSATVVHQGETFHSPSQSVT